MKLYQSYLKWLSEETENGLCSVVLDSLMCYEVAFNFSTTEVNKIRSELIDVIVSITKKMGWYSGRYTYPIDSGDSSMYNPGIAYVELDLWDQDTEYGLRRIYVANELANYIKSKGY